MDNKLVLLLAVVLVEQQVDSITFVYNLRARRSFNIGKQKKQAKKICSLTILPYIQHRDFHVQDANLDVRENRLSGGTVVNIRCNPVKDYWFEFTTGVEKERLKACGTFNAQASRTGFDDVVFQSGYNVQINSNFQIVPYVFAGFPTTRTVTLAEARDTLVGTRLFSLGFGSEFSYRVLHRDDKQLLVFFQTRFIHFFDRRLVPILPPEDIFAFGNLTDILVSLQYRWNHHVFEAGFNPEFYTNSAVKSPTDCIKGPVLIRLFPYASFAHTFQRTCERKTPITVDVNFAYGRQKVFNLNIYEFWMDFSFNF